MKAEKLLLGIGILVAGYYFLVKKSGGVQSGLLTQTEADSIAKTVSSVQQGLTPLTSDVLNKIQDLTLKLYNAGYKIAESGNSAVKMTNTVIPTTSALAATTVPVSTTSSVISPSTTVAPIIASTPMTNLIQFKVVDPIDFGSGFISDGNGNSIPMNNFAPKVGDIVALDPTVTTLAGSNINGYNFTIGNPNSTVVGTYSTVLIPVSSVIPLSQTLSADGSNAKRKHPIYSMTKTFEIGGNKTLPTIM